MTEGLHIAMTRNQAEQLASCLNGILKNASVTISVTIVEFHDDNGNYLIVRSNEPGFRIDLHQKVKKPMPKPNTIAVGCKE